jgi:hypothetical protein
LQDSLGVPWAANRFVDLNEAKIAAAAVKDKAFLKLFSAAKISYARLLYSTSTSSRERWRRTF